MSLKLSGMRIFVLHILFLASLPYDGWTAEKEAITKASTSSSTPRIEEIDDDAEKSKSSMPNITATYPSEAINFFDDQARRMPFQLGFEFQEIKGLCKWALANNTFQKKPFFYIEDRMTKKRLWHLVIDTSDIEFVTVPFADSEETDLEKCMDSILLSFNVLESMLLEQRSISFNKWAQDMTPLLEKHGFSIIYLPAYDLIRNKNLECSPGWVPAFTPQATIQHPLEYTIPLSFMLFGFNDPRYMFSFCGSLPCLDTLRSAQEDGDYEQFFSIVRGYSEKKLSGLVFLHAHTLAGMAGKADSDDKLLKETLNHLQDNYQVDPKLKVNLMSRRPFSAMFENLKLKIHYTNAFMGVMSNNSSFMEDIANFPKANYAEQHFHTETGLVTSLIDFLPLFTTEFANANAPTLNLLLSQGVMSTTMLRNFRAEVMTDNNQPVAQLSAAYCRSAINSVEKPEKRYNISLEKPGVTNQPTKYDALSPPWFLDLENSMGALKDGFVPKFGEAIVEFRGIRNVQPPFLKRAGLSTDILGNFLTNPKKDFKTQALSLFRYLRDFGKPRDLQDFSLGLTLAVAKY